MNIVIDELQIDEIEILINLVNDVFDEFVGKDYSDEGNKTFKEYLNHKNVLEKINTKNNIIFTAKQNNGIVGVLEIRNNNHISLFFVKKKFHKKGIGKKLFEHFINKLKRESIEVNVITVNSSIYAESIYAKLGFIKRNELQEKNGIKFIPMECKLEKIH